MKSYQDSIRRDEDPRPDDAAHDDRAAVEQRHLRLELHLLVGAPGILWCCNLCYCCWTMKLTNCVACTYVHKYIRQVLGIIICSAIIIECSVIGTLLRTFPITCL